MYRILIQIIYKDKTLFVKTISTKKRNTFSIKIINSNTQIITIIMLEVCAKTVIKLNLATLINSNLEHKVSLRDKVSKGMN